MPSSPKDSNKKMHAGDCTFKYACIIPTYNGLKDLERLIASIKEQTLSTDILVVDSSSTDGTHEFALQTANQVVKISTSQFNHGGTRQYMAEMFPEYDIFIYLTQDAYLTTPDALIQLVREFKNEKVAAVCGRQLPHIDANPIAAHARLFNYPSTSHVRSAQDIPTKGIKAAFMSNSFSAYRRTALLDVGGFPSNVILSEDMYVAAKMILNGWLIAYEGTAQCHHSHNYTLVEEAKRYFDIGAFFSEQHWLLESFGSPKGEGKRFVISELFYLFKNAPSAIPNALARVFLKLIFYNMGKKQKFIPHTFKKKLSMHKNYWKN